MDVKDIEKIISILRANDVTEFELEQEGTRIRLTRMSGTQISSVVVESARVSSNGQLISSVTGAQREEIPSRLVPVESPVVGTFYRKPAPDAQSFTSEGQMVRQGDTLCIVEAMKVMNEIEAPCSGKVERVMLKDGDVVEFGETLFLIDPSM